MGKARQLRRRLATVAVVGLLPLLLADSVAATTPRPSGTKSATILGSVDASPAISTGQLAVHRLVNQTRSAYGRFGLRRATSAMASAQAWAVRLRACQCLRHRAAPFGAPSPWYAAAENVGRGYTLSGVHRAFLRSPAHFTNILTPRMTHIATGVARDADGEYFVVQAFYDLK